METEECGTDVNWSKMCNWIPPFSVNTKSITDVGISPNNHICPVTYIDNQQCCCNICFCLDYFERRLEIDQVLIMKRAYDRYLVYIIQNT